MYCSRKASFFSVDKPVTAVCLCLNPFICSKGIQQWQCINKLCRSASCPNILFLVHLRQAEVPAHIVMEDISSWLEACSSETPQGEAVDGSNQGRRWSCQPDWGAKHPDISGTRNRMLSWCSVRRKTNDLLDEVRRGLNSLGSAKKLKRGISSLEADIPEELHQLDSDQSRETGRDAVYGCLAPTPMLWTKSFSSICRTLWSLMRRVHSTMSLSTTFFHFLSLFFSVLSLKTL